MSNITLDLSTSHRLMKTEGLACCGCGKVLDGAAGAANPPKNGDLMICVYCGEIMVYRGMTALTLEAITDGELERLEARQPDVFGNLMRISVMIAVSKKP